MKLTFVGSGSAFTLNQDNYQSNLILTNDENTEHLLIDCGSDARISLNSIGYSYKDITHVYISHLHADHVGGLEWLGLTTYFDQSCDKPFLFAHPSILKEMWNHTLSGGMRTIHYKRAALRTYFNVTPSEKNKFIWNDIEFHLVKEIHVYADKKRMPCYGLFFKIKDKKIFFTADTTYQPEYLHPYYAKADIIFHDCETSEIASGVHAHFKNLCKLDDTIKKKMWLYHYNPGDLPDPIKHGFIGFVKRGQVFEF